MQLCVENINLPITWKLISQGGAAVDMIFQQWNKLKMIIIKKITFNFCASCSIFPIGSHIMKNIHGGLSCNVIIHLPVTSYHRIVARLSQHCHMVITTLPQPCGNLANRFTLFLLQTSCKSIAKVHAAGCVTQQYG